MRALVVFHDKGHGYFSNFLKSGFKHCAVIIDDGEYWVAFDQRANSTDVLVLGTNDIDIANDYADCTIVGVDIYRRPIKSHFFSPNTCVTSIKRILGIRAKLVQTPYQLYLYLERSRKVISNDKYCKDVQ